MSGKLTSWLHQACTQSTCVVEHMKDLNIQLQQYVNELSRIMFRKENLRGDRSWRLPAFYSLCIQSLVRKGLISVFGNASTASSHSKCLGQHLQLAVQLFIALSPGFDTFMRSEDWSLEDPLKAPRLAIGHARWVEGILKGSSTYLQTLFDIISQSTSSDASWKKTSYLDFTDRQISSPCQQTGSPDGHLPGETNAVTPRDSSAERQQGS